MSRPNISTSDPSRLGVVVALVVACLAASAISPQAAASGADPALVGVRTSSSDEAEPFGPGRVDAPTPSNRVKAAYFGIGLELFPDVWPQVGFGAARLVLYWPSVEKSVGTYDWRAFDERVDTSKKHGTRPLITFQGTPKFRAIGAGPITPASPPDLAAYRAFVRAAVERYGNRVDYQVWNEPNVSTFYTGTREHMARMTNILSRAVRRTAPRSLVVAPSMPLRGESEVWRNWFKRYWALKVNGRPVARMVDVAAVSAYPMQEGDPEDALAITQWVRTTVARRGFTGPVWATELNYGANGGPPTARIPVRRQVSFVVRTYVLQSTVGADRVFLYSWYPDPTVNTHLRDVEGNITPPGTAYEVVQDWILGSRPTGCSITRGVTTCGFRVGAGVRREISWTRSERIRPLVVPEGAVRRVDPAGVESDVTPGAKIRVGVTPVMIEVRRPR